MVTSIASKDVKMNFGSKKVLRGLSFEIKPPEIVFLAGRNGVGKTTWIRIAAGISRPSSGAVLFNENLKAEKIRDKLSVVFDEPPVYPNFSGFDNLRLLTGVNRLDDWSNKILANFQLEATFLKNKAGHYSFGQKHRLAVAAAILRRPDYLFLDEPTVGLDPVSWRLVEDGIRHMANNGAAILLTGQDFDLVEPLVNKVVIIHDGVAAFSGSLKELNEKFPPSIRVRASNHEAIRSAFPRTRLIEPQGDLLEIICSSDDELNAAPLRLQQLGITLQELYVCKSTLREAFLKVIGEIS